MPSGCLTIAIMMRYGWSVNASSHAHRWCHRAHTHTFADDEMKIPIGPQHIGIFGEELAHTHTHDTPLHIIAVNTVPWNGHPANDHHVTCEHVESDFVRAVMHWTSVCADMATPTANIPHYPFLAIAKEKNPIFRQNFTVR